MTGVNLSQRLGATIPFIRCCDQPYLRLIEEPSVYQTTEPGLLRLDQLPLATCGNCQQLVAVCPQCERGFDRVASLAEWQNHYSQFAYYDGDTVLQRAQLLLGASFPDREIESGHRFYTLWQGVCSRHAHSYIWLQERPAKYS